MALLSIASVGRLTATVVIIVAALALGRPRTAHADVATAPQLKAAFLLNFAKFTTWTQQALPQGSPLVMCVTGDSRVADALEELVRRQTVGGHALVVSRLAEGNVATGCHVLYASGLKPERERTLLDTTRDQPVLTASDSNTFIRHGGIAALRIAGGKMKFSVNLSAAERASLRISSRMLSLAEVVKDGDASHAR